MSTLVCLGAGIEGLPILERVKALGHRLVVVDGNPDAPGRKLSQFFVEASCYDAKQTINVLARLAGPSVVRARAWPYDGVLCCAIDAPPRGGCGGRPLRPAGANSGAGGAKLRQGRSVHAAGRSRHFSAARCGADVLWGRGDAYGDAAA